MSINVKVLELFAETQAKLKQSTCAQHLNEAAGDSKPIKPKG
jgi:hypothetical protein